MTINETFKLAKECGADVTTVQEGQFFSLSSTELLEFAARIEALALEQAAKVCEERAGSKEGTYARACNGSAFAIRALKLTPKQQEK